jgi:hypothetical protein
VRSAIPAATGRRKTAEVLSAIVPKSISRRPACLGTRRCRLLLKSQRAGIRERVAEILQEREQIHAEGTKLAIERTAIDKEWVIERLRENVERAMQAQPLSRSAERSCQRSCRPAPIRPSTSASIRICSTASATASRESPSPLFCELEKADTESGLQKRKQRWQYKILKVIDEVR